MPRRTDTALLVIDVINDLAFSGGEKVLPWAEKMAGRLGKMLKTCRSADVPVIYVNDNFGLWQSDFAQLYRHATRSTARGKNVVRKLKPGKKDFFILKPKHSAFFATSLVPLLEHLGVDKLIITGIATNLCVLFTAHDAHMHEYKITVLSDCCCAESDFDHNTALDQLKRFLGATVKRADELKL